jgi:hypothetical protein
MILSLFPPDYTVAVGVTPTHVLLEQDSKSILPIVISSPRRNFSEGGLHLNPEGTIHIIVQVKILFCNIKLFWIQ